MVGSLFGKGPSGGDSPAYTGLDVQTSVLGAAIPVLIGKDRVVPNLIWYGDFKSTKQKQGGKGGGGGKSGGVSYTYSASIAMALCEGQIASIGTVWRAKGITSMSALGLTLFNGSQTSAWSYLTSKYPSAAFVYPNTAYVAVTNLQLGNSPTIGNFAFEAATNDSVAYGGEVDLDIASLCEIVLTNTRRGVGFSQAASFTDPKNYCKSLGLIGSLYQREQQPVREILTRLARSANMEWLWSGSALKLIPQGDSNVSGNGFSWTADTTPLFALGEADFLKPVTHERTRASDVKNVVKVEWKDRANQYNVAPAEFKDEASISQIGTKAAPAVQAHHFKKSAPALLSAQFEAARYTRRNSYRVPLDARYSALEPLDYVTLTDTLQELTAQPVRIDKVTISPDGTVNITAKERQIGAGDAVAYTFDTGSRAAEDFNAAAANVVAPYIFEPPSVLTDGRREVWIAVAGTGNWGGCEIWTSDDNSTYRFVDRIEGPARYGTTSTSMTATASPDVTNTPRVNVSAVGGELTGTTTAGATALNTLAMVDGELIAYRDATLVSAGVYDLGYLIRGARGTPIASHSSGAPFVRLDENIVKLEYDATRVGQTVYFKFVSFNATEGGRQDISAVTAYSKLLGGGSYYDVNNASVPASTDNLVIYSQFEEQMAGWQASATYGAAVTFGTNGQKKTATIAQTFTAGGQFNSFGTHAYDGAFPVVAGKRYFARAEVGTTGSGVSVIGLQIQWLNAANGLISTDNIGSASGGLTFPVQLKLFATAPAGAVRALLYVYINSIAAASNTLIVADPFMVEAHASQTFEPGFTTGPRPVKVEGNALINSAWSPDIAGWGSGWDGNTGLPTVRTLLSGGANRANNVLSVQVVGTPAAVKVFDTHGNWPSPTTFDLLCKYGLKVKPGDRVFVSGLLACGTAGALVAGYMRIQWHTVAGVYISEEAVSPQYNLPQGANGDPANFKRSAGFVTAPAGAVWAYINARFQTADSGAVANPTALFTQPYACVVPATQIALPSYQDGPKAWGAGVSDLAGTEKLDNDLVPRPNNLLSATVPWLALTGWQTYQSGTQHAFLRRNDGVRNLAGEPAFEIAQTGTLNEAGLFYQDIPCDPGRRFEASVYTGAIRCAVFLYLEWYTSAYGYLGGTSAVVNNAEAAGGPVISDFKRLSIFAVPPAGAAIARFGISKGGTASGSTSFGFYARPYFGVATAAQTDPSPWQASGERGANVTQEWPSDGLIASARYYQDDTIGRLITSGVERRQVQDGDSGSFAVAYPFAPKMETVSGGLVYTNTGLTGKQIRQDSYVVTPTTWSVSAKLVEAVGTVTTQTQSTWTTVTLYERYECDKPTSANAWNNVYRVQLDVEVYKTFSGEYEPGLGYRMEGWVEITIASNDGGGWVDRTSVQVYASTWETTSAPLYETVFNVPIDATVSALTQHAGKEIAAYVSDRSHANGKINGMDTLTYGTATAPASVAATDANNKVLVRSYLGAENVTQRMIRITETEFEVHPEDNPDFKPKWSAPNFAEHGMLPEHADAASEVVVFEKTNKRGEPLGLYKAICPCCKRISDVHGLALHPYWMFDLDWLEAHGQRNRFACTGCRPVAVVTKNGIRKSQMMEALGAPAHFLEILRRDEDDPRVIVD